MAFCWLAHRSYFGIRTPDFNGRRSLQSQRITADAQQPPVATSNPAAARTGAASRPDDCRKPDK